MLIRAQEMARYVEHGALDAGLTGLRLGDGERAGGGDGRRPDLRQAEPRQSALGAGGAGGFAVRKAPKTSPGTIIATELVNVTKNYFSQRGIDVQVEFSWGATEVKPPMLADAIVEVTETGSSLRANHLRIIDTVLGIEHPDHRQQDGLGATAASGGRSRTSR